MDIIRKVIEAKRHPGISSSGGLSKLVRQGLPYLLSPAGNARPPITIYWNVNSVCNLHCKMCDVGTFNEEANFYRNLRIDRKLHEIDPERFKSVVDEVAPYGTLMAINGTEPLMYSPLEEVIEYADKKGLETAVTTGAWNLPARADKLAEAGLTRLNVSIDGPADLHDKIRGRAGVFERAVTGLERFHQRTAQLGNQASIYLNFTVTNMNYDSLVSFYQSVRELPVDKINFFLMLFVTAEMAEMHNRKWGSLYPATVNCLNEDTDPTRVDLSVLSEEIAGLKQLDDPRVELLFNNSPDALEKFFRRPNEFMGKIPCMSTWFFAQVQADGEIMPYTRCYPVHLGNINQHKFMDIWNGDAAKNWRKQLRRVGRFPACARCDLVC